MLKRQCKELWNPQYLQACEPRMQPRILPRRAFLSVTQGKALASLLSGPFSAPTHRAHLMPTQAALNQFSAIYFWNVLPKTNNIFTIKYILSRFNMYCMHITLTLCVFIFLCSQCHYRLSANDKMHRSLSANCWHSSTAKHPEQPPWHHPALGTFYRTYGLLC